MYFTSTPPACELQPLERCLLKQWCKTLIKWEHLFKRSQLLLNDREGVNLKALILCTGCSASVKVAEVETGWASSISSLEGIIKCGFLNFPSILGCFCIWYFKAVPLLFSTTSVMQLICAVCRLQMQTSVPQLFCTCEYVLHKGRMYPMNVGTSR